MPATVAGAEVGLQTRHGWVVIRARGRNIPGSAVENRPSVDRQYHRVVVVLGKGHDSVGVEELAGVDLRGVKDRKWGDQLIQVGRDRGRGTKLLVHVGVWLG